MANFNDFVQTELPLRPFVKDDGVPGQVLVRSGNTLAPREVVFVDANITSGNCQCTPSLELYTTNKILIEDNKILLPYKPSGNSLFNLMLVYAEDDSITEYDGVEIQIDGSVYFAILNESFQINGYGVITYLVDIATAATDASLVTTSKIEILNNRILLPSQPFGLASTIMLVYELSGNIVEYDGITVLQESNLFYACLNEPDVIEGHGVVSYLTKGL